MKYKEMVDLGIERLDIQKEYEVDYDNDSTFQKINKSFIENLDHSRNGVNYLDNKIDKYCLEVGIPYFYVNHCSFYKDGYFLRLLDILKEYGMKIVGHLGVSSDKDFNFGTFTMKKGLEVFKVIPRTKDKTKGYQSFEIYGSVFSLDLALKIKNLHFEFKVEEEEKGSIYVLVDSKNGLQPYHLGHDYHELERDNYSQDVLDAYDKTIKEFNSNDPVGTISIFSGKPGCGKTFLIRSIVGNIKNTQFLYMPADLIRTSTGPHLIKVLQDMSEKMSDHPVYGKPKLLLILEDADLVLAPREQTDISGISSLLNLTDGIIGKLLNVRIVATTNAKAETMDKAFLRKGRICSDSTVGPLPYDQSVKIYEKLGGKGKLSKKEYVLADLYYYAKHPEEKPKEERRVGFL